MCGERAKRNRDDPSATGDHGHRRKDRPTVARRGAGTVLKVRRIVLALPLVLAIVAAGCGGGSHSSKPAASSSSKFRGGVLHPSIAPANFALRDQSGQLVSLARQRGHFAVITFLYTHCPDVCPLIASNLAMAQRQLATAGTPLTVLAVSVDPKRDTPAAVKQFIRLHRLQPSFHYLTGTRPQLARIWKSYGIIVQPGQLDTVDHAAYEMLVDPKGRARLIWSPKASTSDVVHDVKLLA
jgi:protein SCO1/2